MQAATHKSVRRNFRLGSRDKCSVQARSNSFESGSAKTLNQLLVEMDGFEANEGVVVIGATNLEQKLDAALTRPGRFDREVAVPLPDVRGRLDIIEYYLKVLYC